MTTCHILAFLTGKRRVVDDKVHGDGWLGYLLERNRLRMIRRTERIADMDIRDAGNCYDRADTGFCDFNLI